jgi:hypothetical protein
MTTFLTPPPRSPVVWPRRATPTELLEVVRVLLVVQGAMALLTTIETAAFLALQGTSSPGVLVPGLAAVVTFILAARIGRGGPASRRLVIALELSILAVGGVNVVLAAFMARAFIGLMPAIAMFVLPLAVLGLVGRAQGRR